MPLTAKQADFVENYCNIKSETYNNIMGSMLKAGYKDNYARHWNNKILDNIGIKQAIVKYRAGNKVIADYNYDVAMAEVDSLILALTSEDTTTGLRIVNKGDKKLLLDAIKLKGELTGLFKLRVIDETEQAQEIADTDKAQADMIAKYLLKQSIAKQA